MLNPEQIANGNRGTSDILGAQVENAAVQIVLGAVTGSETFALLRDLCEQARIADRGDIAQTVVNTPENLVRWIRKPTDIRPRTRMPIMGVSEQEAKDIAAYLYTLE